MKIVEFSIRRRVTVSMVVVVIVILGLVSYTRLGLDLLPDMELPNISVVTSYQGVSSEDIEKNITRPIEQWVSTVSNVKEVKSVSQEGSSIVMIEFDSGTNLDFAAQDVREKISLFNRYLPDGAMTPMVVKFNFADFPILIYGATWESGNLRELREFLDNEVASRLERLSGVASVLVMSPEESEVLVNIDKSKLESRGLSISQVKMVIRASNINLPSGYITEGHKEFLIRTIGEFKKVSEIKDLVIGAGKKGNPIFLRDIGTVKETSKELRSMIRINAHKGVMLIVTKSSGANTVLVARDVKETLEKILPTLNKKVNLYIGMDSSRIIEIMSSKSASNIILGGLLAMILIFVFLRNYRPTIAIAIAIPLSVITTFIALFLADYTLNLITLGGLALGVGMLVDNAVVVIENIFRHLEEGKSPVESANIGTTEVGMAITASTMTTIAVFFPMLFGEGIAGTLSRGIAASVSFSLLASLFVALTIIPMLASWFFKKKGTNEKKGVKLGKEKFQGIRYFYGRLLNKVLKKRAVVLILTLVLFIFSIIGALYMGTEFMPESDKSLILLKLKMPVGTTIKETSRMIKYIEDQAMKDKNALCSIVSVGKNSQQQGGSESGISPSGSNEAMLWAYLKTSSKRNISDKMILEQWRQYFPDLKKGKLEFIDIGASFTGGGSSPISFSFFGKEMKILEEITNKVKDEISGIKGIRDVKITLEKSKPELNMVIKKEEASKLGLTSYDISSQIELYTVGSVATRMMLNGEERDIRVRLNKKDRDTIQSIKKLPIMTPRGQKIYLSQIVEFKDSFGAVKIERENQVRKVSVNANYIDRNLGDIVEEITQKSKHITDNLPDGYFAEMGGQYKDMTESFNTMFLALLLAIILVYAIMASQFENLLYPFIVMFTIPLAFIGVVLLLVLSGKNISLASIMGFIMLAGIVVNNGIVMVDYINQLIAGGLNKFDAVVKGAVVRFRPILITAFSTILGMLPMAISVSEGSEMRSPMAIAVVGGLLASTFLTLFVIPILYTYFAKIKVK